MTAAQYYSSIFPSTPESVAVGWQEFAAASACPNSNFLKGVKWSPDGSCCLTAGDDNRLRVFDLPQQALQRCLQQQGGEAAAVGEHLAADGSQWQSGLQVAAGESVYDYAWFSGMSAADPASCCFASSSRGQPIKMWDACSGELRASYRAYDDADEITAATSLAFSPDGTLLAAGYNKTLRVFHVARPGRDCRRITTHKKRQEGCLPGIVGCVAFNGVQRDLMAAGSYGRSIGLFDARSFEQLMLLDGHTGGVTQVTFSPDGNFLYSGARRDDLIYCWDVRSTGQALYSLTRCAAATNQRIGFSIEPCGRHLATGGCDGFVRVFDLTDGQLVGSFRAASDTVNGVDFSPCLNLLVTASGHRRYKLPADADDAADAPGSGSSSSSRKRGRDGAAAGAAAGFESGSFGCQAAKQQGEQQQDDADGWSAWSLSSLRPGGECNSFRLWQVQAEWHAAAGPMLADAEASEAADGARAAAEEAAALEG